MRYSFALLILMLIPFLRAYAQYTDGPNPGNTGAYAFSFIDHATDATIGDDIIIDVKLDAGKDNLGTVEGGILRLKIPFAHWVEIEADLVSDQWQVSDGVKEEYGLKGNTGKFDGDVNFKTKVRILTESKTSNRPALAFQATVKTAAGDYVSGHRYTDSAGYEFAILGCLYFYRKFHHWKTFLESDDAIIRKVKILTEIAFIAWDTQQAEQNDAYKASAGIQIEGEKFKMRVSYLGYYGWQIPNSDHVSTLQLEASKNLKPNFQVYGQVNLGLSQAATPIMVGAGIRYYLPAPKKKRKPISYDQ